MSETENTRATPDTSEASFEYGPVEIYLIGFDRERPGPDVVTALRELIQSGSVRLLDLLFVSRSPDGELRILELEETVDHLGLEGIEILELGLAGEEDVEDLAIGVAPGTSAALLVVEHVSVRNFAEALYRAGGSVLQMERIPAPVVNEMVAAVR